MKSFGRHARIARWRCTLFLSLPIALAILSSSPMRASFAAQDDGQSCNGSDQRCPDGKYHAPDGSVQPDSCDNTHDNSHACDCERGDMQCASHPDENRDHPGAKCQTYCRPKACKCANPCDS